MVVGVSREWLYALFMRALGKSPSRLMKCAQVRYARQLIREGATKTEIADRAAFGHARTFFRALKRARNEWCTNCITECHYEIPLASPTFVGPNEGGEKKK